MRSVFQPACPRCGTPLGDIPDARCPSCTSPRPESAWAHQRRLISAKFRRHGLLNNRVVDGALLVAIAVVILALMMPSVTTLNRSALGRAHPPISGERAMAVAREYCHAQVGMDVAGCRSSVEKEGELWHVRLIGDPPTPGDHCSIFVDANGRVVSFMGGL